MREWILQGSELRLIKRYVMTKLNLAATKIMNVSSFTRGQARQMLLQIQSENKCTIETACNAVIIQLEKIKRAGVKGRVNGEKLKGELKC